MATKYDPKNNPKLDQKRIDWESWIEKKPFVAQTVNGTARPFGTGWNKLEPYDMPELAPDRTRPAGRSNRTGE
jgi:hypothetical protein